MNNRKAAFQESKITLLLVEDEVFIALAETAMLKKHGYSVVSVPSGEKAIQTVDEIPIDLILMDIDLGKDTLDGRETAQKILEKHDLPIVFLTNHSEQEIVDKVKGITRYGYVLKNSGEFVVIEAINMAFELFNSHKKMQAEVRDRQQAELILTETLQISQNIVHSIPSGLFIYQFREPDRLYLLTGNPESERLTNIDLKSSIGKEFNEIWPNARETGLTNAIVQTYRTGNTYEAEELFYQDEKITGVFRIRAFKMPENQIGVAFEDITKTKTTERELNRNRKLLDSIIENIPTLIFLKESRNLSYILVNNAGKNFLGFPREDIIGKSDFDLFPEEEARFFRQKDREVLTTGNPLEIPEETIRTAGGTKQIYTRKVPIYGTTGKPEYLLSISEDITDRLQAEKELKESEERFRSVVQMARDAIVVCNFDDSIILWNAGAERIFGYSSEEITGSTVDLIIPEKFRGKYRSELRKRSEIGSKAIDTSVREFKAQKKDGSEIMVERSISTWTVNEQSFITRIYRDVTQRKKQIQALQNTNAELEKVIREKEYLLQEINHRVKNNLTMITALFRLKASSLGGDADFSDMEHQIDAIRIVHDKLYQTDHITHINLKLYTQELLETIFSSFTERQVEIINSIPNIHVPTKHAVSLGLIFNEAATNAIKHGFTDNKKFEFAVTLKHDRTNNVYVFTISNSGNPVPEGVSIAHPKTLGLQIISMLVDQMDGKIALKKKPHPEMTIRIPFSSLQTAI